MRESGRWRVLGVRKNAYDCDRKRRWMRRMDEERKGELECVGREHAG